jgi:formamidopyrimidine-DNA glycosylase
MPELPEAEVVVRHLRRGVLGAVVKECWVGRPDIIREGGETLGWYRGARITGVKRYGKSVALACARDGDRRYLVAELGMTGLLLFGPLAPRYHKHTHLVLTLDGGQASDLRYWNPRRFGRIHLLDRHGLEQFTRRRFGCDPLTVSWRDFRALVRGRRGRLKSLLMHQQILAGIGNIYANEILFRAGLHPAHSAAHVDDPALRRLYRVMRQVLAQAIRDGGSSVRDFLAPDGSEGRYRHRHLVYGKAGQPCPARCGGVIERLRGSDQRSSFYCPVCQRTEAAFRS